MLAASFLASAAIFGLSYTQSVLYEGNQNTKFLHGLALAGRGLLREDWLANTADPLPVFSLLVWLTALINENLFTVYYVLLFGVYACSLIGIANTVFNQRWDFFRSIVLFSALLYIHSSWNIIIVQRRTNLNMEYLQYGLADQYLLGKEFQNSSFGVLLLLSTYLFMRKRYFWAVFWLGLACMLHSAYMFSAAFIMIGYLVVLLWENWKSTNATGENSLQRFYKAARQPFRLGLFALALVLPLVLYNQIYLASASAESSAQAMSILIHQRIPHHSLPEVWFSKAALAQIGIMVIGTFLTVRSRLFPVMLSLLLGGAGFTWLQIASQSDNLAMIAPWRVSVLLVPMATTLGIAFALYILIDVLRIGRLPYALLVIPLFLSTANMAIDRGIYLQEKQGTGHRLKLSGDMMAFVSETKMPGDVYLVPPKNSEFDDFRLQTGAPIFINWKSHPYKDSDILEWYQRVQRAEELYNAEPTQQCDILGRLLEDYHITHVVIQSKVIRLACGFTTEIFNNERFVIYALNAP